MGVLMLLVAIAVVAALATIVTLWFLNRQRATATAAYARARCPRTYRDVEFLGPLRHRTENYAVATCSERCLQELQTLAVRDAEGFERTHGAVRTARGMHLHHPDGRHAQHAMSF